MLILIRKASVLPLTPYWNHFLTVTIPVKGFKDSSNNIHYIRCLSDNLVVIQLLVIVLLLIASRSTVRNFEVIFDQNLSFNAHIKQVSKAAFFQLHFIKK